MTETAARSPDNDVIASQNVPDNDEHHDSGHVLDEDDVFEIEDYTVASPFEKLVSLLEQQIRAWQVGIIQPPPHSTTATHEEKTHDADVKDTAAANDNRTIPSVQRALVTLATHTYALILVHTNGHHQRSNQKGVDAQHKRAVQPDIPSSRSLSSLSLPQRVEHLNCSDLHPLCAWFGVRSFLLLQPTSSVTPSPSNSTGVRLQVSPVSESDIPAVLSPSPRRVSKNESSMLLSALSLASNAAHCTLACFVPMMLHEGSGSWSGSGSSKQLLYWGRCCFGSVARFDQHVGEEVPVSFRHLAGMTEHVNAIRERNDGRTGLSSHSMSHSHSNAATVQGGTTAPTGATRTLISTSFGFQLQTKKWGYQDIGALASLRDDGESDSEESDPSFIPSSTSPPTATSCRWRDVTEDSCISFGTSWGPTLDPVDTLRLQTWWPFFPEGTFVDNAVYSDLEPFKAPNWRVSIEWRRDSSSCNPSYNSFTPLSNALHHFIAVGQAGSKVASIATILGSGGTQSETPETLAQSEQEGNHAVTAATVQVQPLSNALKLVRAHIEEATQIATHGNMVPEEAVDRILRNLLDIDQVETGSQEDDGAVGEQAASFAQATSAASAVSSSAGTPPAPPMATTFPFIPSTPRSPFSTTPYPVTPCDPPASSHLVHYGSLLSLFVFHLFNLHDDDLLSVRAVASLWSEFVKELRFHFENSLPLPRLCAKDTPDLKACILQQKLQMLQRCIRIMNERNKMDGDGDGEQPGGSGAGGGGSTWSMDEISRSAAASPSSTQPSSPAAATGQSGWGSLDDLDLGDDNSGPIANLNDVASNPKSSSGWGDLDISVGDDADPDAMDSDEEAAMSDRHDRQPEGVHSLHPSLRLLLHPSEALRIPMTQEPVVRTSDEWEALNDMFARMGTGPEATRRRMEMQTEGLVADMQAFKAANPGCILEDFVRWHSPKDWRPAPEHASDSVKRRGELSQRMRKRRSSASGSGSVSGTGTGVGSSSGGNGNNDPATNLWHQLWRSSKPIPACRQRPLFDPSLEGEQVLNWLETIEPSLLFTQLTGIAIQNVICALARTNTSGEAIPAVVASIQRLHHYLKHFNQGTVPQDLYTDFSSCELTCARATSLFLCLPLHEWKGNDRQEAREMISQLLSTGKFDVSSSVSLRRHLTSLFSCTHPRTKPPSLFATRPYNYKLNQQDQQQQTKKQQAQQQRSSGSGMGMEAAGSESLPKPDWSEYTFFAPSLHRHAQHQQHQQQTIQRYASSPSPSPPLPPLIGSRTYVFVRHSSHVTQPGSSLPLPKFRMCHSALMQSSI